MDHCPLYDPVKADGLLRFPSRPLGNGLQLSLKEVFQPLFQPGEITATIDNGHPTVFVLQ